MKIDLLIIAHFCSDFDGKGNNRFNYIVNLLSEDTKLDVELVTSDFSHIKKHYREKINFSYNYKITMIHEPGYKKNVSLRRFISHYIMGRNLEKYLKQRKRPDLIYCAVPSLDVAKVAAEYAKRNNIKFIIDVQDLWPEAFKMIVKIPIISNFIFYPIQKKADFIYSSADDIIAVSKTYANRAAKVNKKCNETHVVYLGTELKHFDELTNEYKIDKPDDEFWIGYTGTIGHSYDIKCIIDAIEILNYKGIKNIKFLVMGDGPLRESFESYVKQKNINNLITFTGGLEYGRMVSILKSCDIAVNPIRKRAAQSIINKHADYAAAGLPVINTQECEEYRELVVNYNMGLNCRNNDPNDVAMKILQLYNNHDLRKEMGLNSRRLAKEKFDREKSYKEIVNVIYNRLTLNK